MVMFLLWKLQTQVLADAFMQSVSDDTQVPESTTSYGVMWEGKDFREASFDNVPLIALLV